MDIVFVCLSCRRPRHFERAINSFFTNCLDRHLIGRYIVIDDNSPQDDLDRIRSVSPKFELVQKRPDRRGMGPSLNLMLDMAGDGLILYWEDDAVLTKAGHWISRAGNLMDKQGFAQIVFDSGILREPCLRRIARAEPASEPSISLEYRPDIAYADPSTFRYNIDPWPGAVVRPGLLNAKLLRKNGISYHDHDHSQMEYRFSMDFGRAGLTSAILSSSRIFDLGYDVSAHVLNSTYRSFDTKPDWRAAGSSLATCDFKATAMQIGAPSGCSISEENTVASSA